MREMLLLSDDKYLGKMAINEEVEYVFDFVTFLEACIVKGIIQKEELIEIVSLLKKQKEEKNAPQMEFEDGLKRVHEWFTEKREDIENKMRIFECHRHRWTQTFLQAKTFTKKCLRYFFASQKPLLKMLTQSAAEIVGRNLKKGAIVVLESTVYPGVTEEVIASILDLENKSGLTCGADFKIGYSPERINPGDEAHALNKITKIVAGMDEDTTEMLAELYGLITNVYKAKDIKTAEAA